MTPRWGNGPPAPGIDTGRPPRPGGVPTPQRREAPHSATRGVLVSRPVHPPLWPLLADGTTPVLSVARLGQRAARRRPESQGLIVAFAGRHGSRLTVSVNGLQVARLLGRRDRPWFVELERGPWTVRAGAVQLGRGAPAVMADVAVPAPRHRQVDLLWFRFDGQELRCDVSPLRPGIPT